MSDLLVSIGVIFVLLLIGFLFSAAEMALVTLRDSQIQRLQTHGKRGQAIQKMVADVKAGTALPGQLIIYPQGTRVAAGARQPYKVGVRILYEQVGQDCVPAATNVGVFWPRSAITRKPGLAVVEFLPAIPPGLPVEIFMDRLSETVETASEALMAEAGWRRP